MGLALHGRIRSTHSLPQLHTLLYVCSLMTVIWLILCSLLATGLVVKLVVSYNVYVFVVRKLTTVHMQQSDFEHMCLKLTECLCCGNTQRELAR